MPVYRVYQVKLTQEQSESIGDQNNVPQWYKDYIDTTIYPNAEKVNKAFYLYSHVGNVTAKSLDEVYHIGNDPCVNENIEYVTNPSGRNMHNLTVGDVVIDPEGNKYFVNFTGFGEL